MTGFDIGILAGSGPEAGIDLWQAVLAGRRARLGAAYRGDIDAPSVMVRSDPRLGASMDLASCREEMADLVVEHARILDVACGAWAIACNTLNGVVDDVHAVGVGRQLVTFPGALQRWLDAEDRGRVVLLGAAPVSDLGEHSAYHSIGGRLVAMSDGQRHEMHELIQSIKVAGPFAAERDRFAAFCDTVDADHIVLACTELSLVADPRDERFVDVTRLVAHDLLEAR
ncbi:MAG: aspartate/glutamate racemase family protein [Actinomycetota bacterium]